MFLWYIVIYMVYFGGKIKLINLEIRWVFINSILLFFFGKLNNFVLFSIICNLEYFELLLCVGIFVLLNIY